MKSLFTAVLQYNGLCIGCCHLTPCAPQTFLTNVVPSVQIFLWPFIIYNGKTSKKAKDSSCRPLYLKTWSRPWLGPKAGHRLLLHNEVTRSSPYQQSVICIIKCLSCTRTTPTVLSMANVSRTLSFLFLWLFLLLMSYMLQVFRACGWYKELRCAGFMYICFIYEAQSIRWVGAVQSTYGRSTTVKCITLCDFFQV